MTDWLRPGQTAVIRRTFGQDDFDRFAALSGDDNPIHVDPTFAARTKFGRTVAHGMLLYSAVSGVLGSRLPGPAGVSVGQELIFPTPTYSGEEIVIRVEVSAASAADGLAELSTTITRPDGSLGLDGRAWVRPNGDGRAAPQPQASREAQEAETPFKGMRLGQRAETSRVFSSTDLTEYGALAGPGYAAGESVPGPLLGGLFSYLLGTRLPGQGTNYLKQRLSFPTPAYAGEVLTASVEIVRIRRDKQLLNLATVCTRPTGAVVCEGEALVLISDVSEELHTQRQ